jgi:hypothetical protein
MTMTIQLEPGGFSAPGGRAATHPSVLQSVTLLARLRLMVVPKTRKIGVVAAMR